MGKLNWGKRACAVVALCAATATALPAQTFTTLLNFDGTNGSEPLYGSLAQGRDGNLWGTTCVGGGNGAGTVFKMTPTGNLTTVHDFDYSDGSCPYPGPVLGTDGNFYGTTYNGKSIGLGVVYKLTPGGALTVLHTFDGTAGSPTGALVQGRDGNFYGTTYAFSGGTIFKVTPSGTLNVLHAFTGPDGRAPATGLVVGTDGNLYGTTAWGGAFDMGGETGGTVFKISPAGSFTLLHSFSGPDGETLTGALIQAEDGYFYGTSEQGGNFGYGTIFKITPAGTVTTLYSFDVTDGQDPLGALVQGTDGNLYGTTGFGGNSGLGTLFKITTAGALTVMHSFNGTDGSTPYCGLAQDTNGKFYGSTVGGGTDSDGTLFSLSVGLRPFVETQPARGKVGAPVKILGTNLTGSTSVTFNGTAAVFHVVSPSFITATVPVGATSGKVQVVTPSLKLSSNVPFRVAP